MSNPYGADIPSPIARPVLGAGRRNPVAPARRFVPRVPRQMLENERDAFRAMQRHLNEETPKIARFLHGLRKEQQGVFTYQEIRNAIRDGEFSPKALEQWQKHYSLFVTQGLEPAWRQAMQVAGNGIAKGVTRHAGAPFAYTPTGMKVEQWITERGGELAVNLNQRQHAAMQSILRHYTVDIPTSPHELGTILRPVVGLTPKQAGAVQKLRDELVAQGLTSKVVEHQVLNYAAFLHRARARNIARTELAFAYNYGQLDAVRTAQTQGFFAGPVVKIWMTAEDERLCDFCRPLDGAIIQLEETFPGMTPTLPNIFVPPAHPQCRCTVGYQVMPPSAATTNADLGPVAKPKPKPRTKVPGPRIHSPKEELGEAVGGLRELGGGVSSTFTAYISGGSLPAKKYMLKSPQPLTKMGFVSGNSEAEVLASEIFRRNGLKAPITRFGKVKVGASSKSYVASEFVEDVHTWDDWLYMYSQDTAAALAKMNLDDIQRMQVIDVLIGNVDRHSGNFFIDKAGRVIPIDHNLAFVTEKIRPGPFTSYKGFLGKDGMAGKVAHNQSPAYMMTRNPMGRGVMRSHSVTHEQYLRHIKEVQSVMSDSYIDDLVGQMTVPVVRKAELKEILKYRRDSLEDFIMPFVRSQIP